MLLKDKVVIVTGGARGIGQGITLALAKENASIVIVDVLDDLAKRVAEQVKGIGSRVLVVKADVSESRQVNEMVQQAIERFLKIDILVNNAGILRVGSVVDLSEEDWEKVISVNLKSVFLCSKAVIPHMIKQKSGKIINIASQAAKTGEAFNSPYCVSKAGVVSLTQCLALELAKYSINVNAICPGVVDTEMMTKVYEERSALYGLVPEEYKRELELAIPLGRIERPDDVAKLVVFLASSESEYMTGQAVNITGGKEFH